MLDKDSKTLATILVTVFEQKNIRKVTFVHQEDLRLSFDEPVFGVCIQGGLN